MADIKVLNELMHHVINKTAPTEFSNVDLKEVLREEIRKLCGNQYEYDRNKTYLFEIMSRALAEVQPKSVIAMIGQFSDITSVADGQRVNFRVKRGRERAKQFITRATPSGVYETFRLVDDVIELYPKAFGGAGIIDFERYLAGLDDIMEVYDIIVEGLTEAVYREVMAAMMASWDDVGRPARNRVWANAFIDTEMTRLINTVAAYGDPVIYTTREFASEMANSIEFGNHPFVADADLLDIRNQGFIGRYRGTPVVVLPNSFDDVSNTKLTFNPRFAFVIPRGNENIVKVVFEGDPYVREWENRDNSREIQGYRKFAVGIVGTPNFWGMYYNAGIDAGGWEEVPQPQP